MSSVERGPHPARARHLSERAYMRQAGRDRSLSRTGRMCGRTWRASCNFVRLPRTATPWEGRRPKPCYGDVPPSQQATSGRLGQCVPPSASGHWRHRAATRPIPRRPGMAVPPHLTQDVVNSSLIRPSRAAARGRGRAAAHARCMRPRRGCALLRPRPAYDLLELFAFACPARTPPPTAEGPRLALRLDPPAPAEAEAVALQIASAPRGSPTLPRSEPAKQGGCDVRQRDRLRLRAGAGRIEAVVRGRVGGRWRRGRAGRRRRTSAGPELGAADPRRRDVAGACTSRRGEPSQESLRLSAVSSTTAVHDCVTTRRS